MSLLRAIMFGLCLISSACIFGGASQVRVTPDYTSQVKNVGVISLLGPRPNVSRLDTSAYDSNFGFAALPGWQVDALVEQVKVPRLKRKGFSVRMFPAEGPLAKAKASDWRAPLGESVAEDVYAFGAAHGLDMVVVVQAQVGEDFVTDTNQKVRGYGIQRAFDTEAFTYASLYVEAYDIERRFAAGRAEGQIVETAEAGAWLPAYDAIKGTVDVDGPAATALRTQLTNIMTAAIGVATQEAGL